MRLRHIPGAEEAIASSPYVIQQPAEYRGRFHELFGNHNPIRIEVGMGKGRFIMEMAASGAAETGGAGASKHFLYVCGCKGTGGNF